MIEWSNFAVLLFSTQLFLFFYVRSASPAGREKVVGPQDYRMCYIYLPIFILLCYAEEQDLLLRYGDAYAEYCKQTGAFWPKRS